MKKTSQKPQKLKTIEVDSRFQAYPIETTKPDAAWRTYREGPQHWSITVQVHDQASAEERRQVAEAIRRCNEELKALTRENPH